MKIDGILFDFDGVILNSMGQHLQAWQYAFRRAGIYLEDLEFYKLEGKGVRALAETLVNSAGLPKPLVDQIAKEKADYYQKIMKVEFFDGFFDLLKFLKSQAIKLGIVTGGSRSRIDPFAELYLKDYFKIIVSADDVKNTKPDPEPYISGAESLGLPPENCIVIENAPLGIRSAKDAGMYVIAIQTTLGAEYLGQADQICESFDAVQEHINNLIAE